MMKKYPLIILGIVMLYAVGVAADPYAYQRDLQFLRLSKSPVLTRSQDDQTEVLMIKNPRGLTSFLQAYSLPKGEAEILKRFEPFLDDYNLLVIFGNGNGVIQLDRLSERNGSTRLYLDIRFSGRKWKRAAPPEGQMYSSYTIVAVQDLKKEYSFYVRSTNLSKSASKIYH